MNQHQALAIASRHISVFKSGDNFILSTPWKDSDRHGPVTHSSHRYWHVVQKRAAVARAELALWVYCDENEHNLPGWRDHFQSCCYSMGSTTGLAYPENMTSRKLLSVAIRDLREALKRDAEATAQAVIDGDHNRIDFDAVLSEFGLDDSFMWTAAKLAPYVTEYAKAHRV